MSVGPGKIRFFRASDEAKNSIYKSNGLASESPQSRKTAKPEKSVAGVDGIKTTMNVATNDRIKSPSKRSGKPKANTSGKGTPSPATDTKAVPLEAIRVNHRLVLSPKQKAGLEALFMAPKALAGLLRHYPQKLVTASDASIFLLSKRKELDSYITPDARGRAVDLLTELLLQWSGSPPNSIGIDFDDVSLTHDQKVYLPLEGYRCVGIAEPMELLAQRKGRLFIPPFTIFEEADSSTRCNKDEPGNGWLRMSRHHGHSNRQVQVARCTSTSAEKNDTKFTAS